MSNHYALHRGTKSAVVNYTSKLNKFIENEIGFVVTGSMQRGVGNWKNLVKGYKLPEHHPAGSGSWPGRPGPPGLCPRTQIYKEPRGRNTLCEPATGPPEPRA